VCLSREKHGISHLQIKERKKERSYRGMLKNIHYSIDPEEIKTEIQKLGHTAMNLCDSQNAGYIMRGWITVTL
jgi:hypothetical protein